MLYTFELDGISLGKYEEIKEPVKRLDEEYLRFQNSRNYNKALYEWCFIDHVIIDLVKGEFYELVRNPAKTKFEELRRKESHLFSNVHSVTTIKSNGFLYLLLNSIWEHEPHGLLFILKTDMLCDLREGDFIGVSLLRDKPKNDIGTEDQLKFRVTCDVSGGLFLDKTGIYLKSVSSYGSLRKIGKIEHYDAVSMCRELKFDT